MGDDQTWQQVLQIIARYDNAFVIVSATAQTTRQLMAAAEQALENPDNARSIVGDIHQRHQTIVNNFLNNYPNAESEMAKECKLWIDARIEELHEHLDNIYHDGQLTARTKDAVASIGERLSSYLFARCGATAGLPTTWIDAADVIRTNSDYGHASPNTDFIHQQKAKLLQPLNEGKIPVMGGYYGQDEQGHTTTLGFEGSDYSASLIGAALSADSIEIWTDVSGIYTCDPRLIEEARPIPQLSFQEATELAYFGAKVLHPSTTKPASQQQIPMRVKNIFEPDAPGTCISHETTANGRAKAMTYKEHCAIITVTSAQTVMGYEFLAGVFDTLRWHHLPVDVVTTTEASVSIAIENGDRLEEAIEQLRNYGSVNVESHQGIISLVGCKRDDGQALIKDILDYIKNTPLKLISFSRSKGNLNIVMDTKHVIPSVKSIHRHIFQ